MLFVKLYRDGKVQKQVKKCQFNATVLMKSSFSLLLVKLRINALLEERNESISVITSVVKR